VRSAGHRELLQRRASTRCQTMSGVAATGSAKELARPGSMMVLAPPGGAGTLSCHSAHRVVLRHNCDAEAAADSARRRVGGAKYPIGVMPKAS